MGDLMYVTSRGMSSAVQGVTKQMEALSGALQVGRKAERQKGRKAERQKGRKAERQKGRKAERQEGRKKGWQAERV